ncbi:MAG: 4'-phosphopantetheinyl transferase superfamily protein [Anaerolineae bacterium]|nr:4'-phosphopantetheinyl transferase superfamily protein [Anaerolineae bacterium]
MAQSPQLQTTYPSSDETPAQHLTLAVDAVHVWRVDLRVTADCVERLATTLSSTERARAARFRFPEHRERFIVAHGALRDILGRYLNVSASELVFEANAHGKPALPEHAWLQFNLTHSGDMALVAVTRDRPVGIDVEHKIPPDDPARLVAQFFSENENATFSALPESQREAAFFTGWTRKEAYIKALGEGLSTPLDQFDVSLAPDQPARLLANRLHPGHPAHWSLLDLDPDAIGPDYAAALAIAGSRPTLTLYHWPPR